MEKNVLVSAGVALLVVVLGLVFFGRTTEKVIERVTERIGAVSGPELFFPSWTVDGVATHYRRLTSFVSATTTPITVRAPVGATSTLMLGSGCHFGIASTVAKVINFSKSVDQNSTTTTLFGSASITASAAASVVATTTDNDFVFEPGYYLNVSLIGGSGTDSPTGNCNFVFLEI